MLLALACDIARLLRLEHDARLDRIDGGVAVRGPGAELVLRGDHIQLTLGDRTGQDWRLIRGHIARTLGAGFPVRDGRRRLTPAPVTEPVPATEILTHHAIVAETGPPPPFDRNAPDAPDMDDTRDEADAPRAAATDLDDEGFGPGL